MESQTHAQFHHALKFREDICIGCSHCMNICPTEAIRVGHGKAQLLANRCVDCGECYRVCPVGAIIVEQDDFENIYNFTTRIALIPSVFTGQFPDSVDSGAILAAVQELGFTHVFEVEEGVEFLNERFNEYLLQHKPIKPLISPFCPAVVRLIQVKFPTLVRNIILLKAPVDITALHARKTLTDQGIDPSEIGIFYVTPCAAKIVAVKSPVGEEKSVIDGVINMNYLYNKIFKILRQNKGKSEIPAFFPLSGKSVCWSLTHGEADHMKQGPSLAIDEINNVIEFLEKVENEEIDGIDFLELRACDESCAGGILCPGNRFMTVDKLRKRALKSDSIRGSYPAEFQGKIGIANDFLHHNISLGEVHPRSMMKLDDNMAEAMIKMKRIYDLNHMLPQVDCGICGSPSCKSLAEDVVQHEASIKQCIFIQKILEQNDKMDIQESVLIMKSIWSDNKLDQNSLKDEITIPLLQAGEEFTNQGKK
ncbi:MAG: 4Fe-4S binding protein [Bacteroidetes bacterium]|nr:4Fe-4S binding protein [Bacteroidota bacterium]